MSERKECCGNCKSFRADDRDDPQSIGECRAHPPAVVSVWQNRARRWIERCVWPVVKRHHWCGEFRERE